AAIILEKPDVGVEAHPGGGLQGAVVREGQVQRGEHGARRDHDEPQDPRGRGCVPESLLAVRPLRQAAAGAAVGELSLGELVQGGHPCSPPSGDELCWSSVTGIICASRSVSVRAALSSASVGGGRVHRARPLIAGSSYAVTRAPIAEE